jgi:hypothetical protein
MVVDCFALLAMTGRTPNSPCAQCDHVSEFLPLAFYENLTP